jgi:hypothetical protein
MEKDSRVDSWQGLVLKEEEVGESLWSSRYYCTLMLSMVVVEERREFLGEQSWSIRVGGIVECNSSMFFKTAIPLSTDD